MNKYIDADKLRAEIERRIKESNNDIDIGAIESLTINKSLRSLLSFLDSLQQEAIEEEKARKKRYNESFMSYWKSVIDTIDNKRVLPSFKGQLLHEFKNELHTMKQIVGLINHPEIHEGLFDKLALVFAAWGGYHFHPKEVLSEDSLQQEQPVSSKGKFVFPNFLYARTVDNKTIDVSYVPQSLDAVEYIKNTPTEQPEADLEKDIQDWMINECGPSDFNPYADHWCADDIINTARHFAEWGTEHLKK